MIGSLRNTQSDLIDDVAFDRLGTSGSKRWLLLLDPKRTRRPQIQKYLDRGLKDGVQNGTLAKQRNHWFAIEKVAPAPLLLHPMTHREFRIVRNTKGVRHTNNLFGLYPLTDDVDLDGVACWLRSTDGQNALRTVARYYGGGMLKLEPRAVAGVRVPRSFGEKSDDLMAKFTVDTHLFSELGALLVGRDSTELNELVKNAYDADASTVIIHGDALATTNGSIAIIDDGVGMTAEAFERGFLRIASRVKTHGGRRSSIFGRRYTGRKGIGRLAAHKLASRIVVSSTPDPRVFGAGKKSIRALIDWDEIERLDTMEDTDRGVKIDLLETGQEKPGTVIELQGMRRKWSASMLVASFVGEVQSFEVPAFLVTLSPKT